MSSIYYHYCSVETLLKIVEKRNLRLGSFREMNDTSEITNLDNILKSFLEKSKLNKIVKWISLQYQFSRNIFNNTYLMSFSREGDLLSQWRAYADNGTGVAIGINFEKLHIPNLDLKDSKQSVLGNIVLYSNVIYSDEEKINMLNEIYSNICDYNEEDLDSNQFKKLENSLDKVSIISKNSSFKDEREVRIIYRYVDSDPYSNLGNLNRPKSISDRKYYIKNGQIVPYHELDLNDIWNSELISEINLGPKCKISNSDFDFKLFLKDNGLENTIINKSECPFA